MHHSRDRIERRAFLKSFGLGITALACSSFVEASATPTAKPNVLFIICDDLNDWALHPAGHPKAKTPNIDRLRNKSVSFSNAHAVVPVCGPSRKCLFSGLYPQTINDYGTPFRYIDDNNRDHTPDEISADWAIDILKQKHDSPFFLGVGFIRPHTPLYAPKQYFDMYPMEDITLPPYKQNDLADCASILRNRWQWGYKKYEAIIASGGEKAWKEWVQAYMACITFVDDQIGRVVDALEASPYHNNTVIVLTGDNGYHLGEKDCIQKWHLWDESTRVPLLVHVPNGRGNGQSCDSPVSLIDVYPTLVDLCGLPAEPNKDRSNIPLAGHSLRPLLVNPEQKEWNGPSVAFMAIRDDKKAPHFSVRSSGYRYTLCSNGEEELYDHEADPNEWTNLAGSPKYARIKKQLREELMTILRATTIPEDFKPGLLKSPRK